MTYLTLKNIETKAMALFDRAARAWARGNNSGNQTGLDRGSQLCDEHRREAETLLAPFGITCDYPGLYPSFTVNGYSYHSVDSALSAAIGEIEVPQPATA